MAPVLAGQPFLTVLATSRRPLPPGRSAWRNGERLAFAVPGEAEAFYRWLANLGELDGIVNCIAVLNRQISPQEPASVADAIRINGWFPQVLAEWCGVRRGCRLIQISTDGVFSAGRGQVTEFDPPDPPDLYGQTKRLGEPVAHLALSVRTSLIGLNPHRRSGFIELARASWGHGYAFAAPHNQLWSGTTVAQTARFCARLLCEETLFARLRALSTVVHYAPNPILTKYELACLVRDVLAPSAMVERAEFEPTTRVLINEARIAQHLPHEATGWPELIAELKALEAVIDTPVA
jgi:dTDP-4-dehydrorhamnose reductase